MYTLSVKGEPVGRVRAVVARRGRHGHPASLTQHASADPLVGGRRRRRLAARAAAAAVQTSWNHRRQDAVTANQLSRSSDATCTIQYNIRLLIVCYTTVSSGISE